MSLREKLAGIKTEQLADLAEIMDMADGVENDLKNANSVIADRDKEIAGLREQNNKLYARMILTQTGGTEEEEEHEETLDEFNENLRKKILGE